ncbi:cytochrome-c peroxidase [Halioglobus sp. HI00S01]|uniref:parallel beta-helix domain-containing protein n=1 Tax=Halioglobus sp. HI00S01 TaxID=1822214 RepID=UPI0007C3A87C|nr:parallel beta-helix domain-containing protein [Halioglobus sp. HI00S01]KZX56169.1 cytochrome-c peroxidase [Halioglobus sp. HI00S01]
MNKLVAAVGAVVLLAGGYYLGNSNTPEPTVIKVPEAPKAAFSSGGADEVAAAGAANVAIRSLATPASGELIVVKDGESIQDAVKAASPGATIKVMPGTYKETVYVDKDNITLSGVIEDGQYPVMDGEGVLNDAVLYSGNGFTVENLYITRYKGNGVMGQAGNNFIIRNNFIIDTGVYGIFPQLGKNGLVSHNVISGIEDAAIYVGMSDNIDVVYNQVFESVAGIEIENSRSALVEANYVYNNTGGILAFITPGLPIKDCSDVIIRNNFVVGNNHENFAIPGSLVSNIPEGTGMLIMACDDVVVENNIITGNDSVGILFTDFSLATSAALDPDSEPNPNRPKILNNLMLDNGKNPTKLVQAFLATKLETEGQDIVDTVGMDDGCILEPTRYRTIGLEKYTECEFDSTSNVLTYMLPEPVAPRADDPNMDEGKLVYYGICAGCHAYSSRMIGPPTQIVQALYMDNPEGIAAFAANPVKKRDDYPEMPPQSHLDEETLLKAAEFMLKLKN